jgi:hypothetical protein
MSLPISTSTPASTPINQTEGSVAQDSANLSPQPSLNLAIAAGSQPRPQIERETPSTFGQTATIDRSSKSLTGENLQNLRRVDEFSTRKRLNNAKTAYMHTTVRALAMGLNRGESVYQLGQTVGKESYTKGEAVGQAQTYISKQQKTVGRDPGQLAYLSPFKDQRFAHLKPKLMIGSINDHSAANSVKRQESLEISLNYLTKLETDANATEGSLKKRNPKLAAQINTAKKLAEKELKKHNNANPDQQLTGEKADDFIRKKTLEKFYNAKNQAGRREFMTSAALHKAGELDSRYREIHMIKGDYAEKDLSSFGKFVNWVSGGKFGGEVRISQMLALGKYKNSFTAWAYRTFAGDTKKGANAGVIKEALATDMMRRLGNAGGNNFVTQKAKIVQATWQDGTPKLMMDISFINREQTIKDLNLSPEAIASDEGFKTFEGRMVEGRLVSQRRNPENGSFENITSSITINKKTGLPSQKPKNGRFPEPLYKEGTSVKGLGRSSMKLIAMRDRDAFGGTGANKGSVGNYFAAIDPGHAYETGHHEINDDGTFKHPNGDDYQTKLKNFEVFGHDPLSEIMRGVRDMKELRISGDDLTIFDKYLEEYGNSNDNASLNYEKEITGVLDIHNKSFDNIIDVFTERLKVYDLVNDDQADDVFNLIENLEKLTSESDWRSESGLVELNRPRITKDANGNFQRTRWDVSRNNDDGTLTLFATRSGDLQSDPVVQKLKAFGAQNHYTFNLNDPEKITLKIDPSELSNALETFSNDRVKAHVKKRLQREDGGWD